MEVVRDPIRLTAGPATGVQPAPPSVVPVIPTVPLPSALLASLPAPSFGSSDTAVLRTAPLPSVPPAPLPVQPPSASAAPLPVPPSGSDGVVRRRTVRSTAGHHSNLHHLPRPVNEAAQAGPPAPITVQTEDIKVGCVPPPDLSLPASSARPLPGRRPYCSPRSTGRLTLACDLCTLVWVLFNLNRR
ncbi:uncharacterized protein LOC115566842 [Xyrichtys novacula]|uniref:Uncharacterized protein LOC115566842 n=1 Tax=Xyrichtys novacula TaxID=13765 RepID=A0AAV1F9N4_XYRNO|nr:uncharacterized protein LOC115566842 [Xyrichtys novacula]